MKITKDCLVDVDKIKTHIAKQGLSRTAFAKRCGVSLNTLRKVLDNNYDYKLSNLLDICKEMKVPICEILKRN